MADQTGLKKPSSRGRAWAALALAAGLMFLFAWWKVPPRFVSADFVCYWSAAEILVSGQSPYDIELQTQVQQRLGWDKQDLGLGFYDCLPYFYPPWFALACAVFLPFGYAAAKYLFFLVNVLCALVAGYLVGDVVKSVPRWVPVVFLPLFVFSPVTMFVGQTSLLVCLLIVLAWRWLDHGRDWAAGLALGWLTFKPQLTAVLLLGVLLWALRQRRWGVVAAFTITLAVLSLGCALLVPTWPILMLQAPRQTPPPTEFYPWIGNAWPLVLRSFDLSGAAFWVPYLALAVPFVVATVWAALDRTRPVADVLSLGFLAAFFVAPYARHYDFPVLVVPLVVLLAGRLSQLAGAALLVALVLLPYVQYCVLAQLKEAYPTDAKFLHEGSFFWIPVLLTAAWIASGLRRGHAPAVQAS
jgi:hypothetical protein